VKATPFHYSVAQLACDVRTRRDANIGANCRYAWSPALVPGLYAN